MKYSKLLIPTLKESPQDAELMSHKLMMRAGLIRKLASGTYTYLPAGFKCLQNVIRIVREEMNRIGALEILMPAIHPEDLWKEAGRLEILGDDMIHFKDRHGKSNVLGPTHEEVVTDLARREINSYKQLPMILYQIQTKFRDEMRPRAGVVRSREFIMKDAYSFHVTEACLDETYESVKQAYRKIFERCGLEYFVVQADPGAMGGGGSEEFVLFSEAGEDFVVRFGNTDHVFASDVASRKILIEKLTEEVVGNHEFIHTHNISSIDSVATFLKVPSSELVKTILFISDQSNLPVVVMVRGDHEVSEYKVRQLVKGARLAKPQEILQFKTSFGFSGPIDLVNEDQFTVLMDSDVVAMKTMIVGANVKDKHLSGVTPFDVHVQCDAGKRMRIGDFRHIRADDVGLLNGLEFPVTLHSAIELGHIFKLLKRYSTPMKASVLNELGKETLLTMGCYGIGVNRLIASAIEQKSTDKGIQWPSTELSPYQVLIITTTGKNEEVVLAADKIYSELIQQGVDVLWDDRNQTAGIKFNDADLMGIPCRITVGPKSVQEGKCELSILPHGTRENILLNAIQSKIQEILTNFKRL